MLIDSDFLSAESHYLNGFLLSFQDIFHMGDRVHIDDVKPLRRRFYRVSGAVRRFIYQIVDKMLRNNTIEVSSILWASTVIHVKQLTWRFCVEHRHLSKVKKIALTLFLGFMPLYISCVMRNTSQQSTYEAVVAKFQLRP